MHDLRNHIEAAWDNRELLNDQAHKDAIRNVIELLDTGAAQGQCHGSVTLHERVTHGGRKSCFSHDQTDKHLRIPHGQASAE